MHLFILSLTILLTIASFTSFIIGKRGDSSVRDWLTKFYVLIDDDWNSLYQLTAATLLEFLKQKLGRNTIASIPRIAIITATYVTLLYLSALYSDLPLTPIELRIDIPIYLGSISGSIVGDVISWNIFMLFLRYFSHSRFLKALILLILFSAISIIVFLLVAFVTAVVDGLVGLAFPIPTGTTMYAFFPVVPTVLLIFFVNLLPLLLFLVISTSGLIMTIGRPILQRPLMLIIERIDDNPMPALSLAAISISAVIEILKALAKSPA